jgi:hypothetical protein
MTTKSTYQQGPKVNTKACMESYHHGARIVAPDDGAEPACS